MSKNNKKQGEGITYQLFIKLVTSIKQYCKTINPNPSPLAYLPVSRRTR